MRDVTSQKTQLISKILEIRIY